MTKNKTDWRTAVPACFDYDPFMTFSEVVWHAQIELDLIEEGQEAAECYTKRQVKQLRKFVKDNMASCKAMSK